ncbi:tripartite motif-containing protein 2-like [Saccoglossus kowalevskii]|uniref:E3 ubiquitin-protein ligase TRIM56-like n=1 Tax=Saccoglossus kowalevskii TaxID=10224 RepID=A0ABM0LY15_SACKO|nr:PREDICTED: E3 ubiquitin-protein ligase TRIM56-like [Saccoglossus kowalevskii]
MAVRISVNKINDQLLTCSICLERYKNPKILPCHHSFCENCLVGWMEQHGGLECPNCRKRYSVHMGSIQTLPPSIVTNSMIRLIEEQENQGGGTCHGCAEYSSANRCVNCAMDLCATCTRAHTKAPITRHHRIVAADHFKQSKGSADLSVAYCTTHDEKIIELYCETCQTSICHLCLRSEHKGHSVVDLQGVADELRNVFASNISQLNAQLIELENGKQNVEIQSKELAKQLMIQKKAIKTHSREIIEQLINVIKLEKRDHLQKITNDYDKLLQEINNEMHQYDTTGALLESTITFVDNLLQYGSDAQLMKESDEASKKMHTVMSLKTKWKDTDRTLPLFCPGVTTVRGKTTQSISAHMVIRLEDEKSPERYLISY